MTYQFITVLLEFFHQMIRITQKLGVSVDLNLHTIFSSEKQLLQLKIADYRLLFHPFNRQ